MDEPFSHGIRRWGHEESCDDGCYRSHRTSDNPTPFKRAAHLGGGGRGRYGQAVDGPFNLLQRQKKKKGFALLRNNFFFFKKDQIFIVPAPECSSQHWDLVPELPGRPGPSSLIAW